MHYIQALQRKDTWQFDISSAIIGAAIAWLIVALIYSKRQQILSLIERVWAPVKSWRRKTRAGQGDKYLKTLQESVKHLLLFQPANPELVFNPPLFKAPPTLPKTLAEAAESSAFIEVPYNNLFDGASRIIIKGPYGSGRTTALVMAIWETAKRAEQDQPFDRIPVWIDLNNIKSLAELESASPLDRLTQLATITLPQVSPKWLQQQLRKNPSVILLDNWDKLPNDDRDVVAAWIAEVVQDLEDSYWIISSDMYGYGQLIEAGFVPVNLQTGWSEIKYRDLVQGWADNLGLEFPADSDEIIQGLTWAIKTEATPLEVVLRTILYLKTSQFPKKPVDTLDFHLEMAIPTPDLGDEMDEVSNQARMIAFSTITKVATTHRLENRWVTRQELLEILSEILPPKEERHKKLEGIVRKILGSTRLLREEKKQLHIPHYVWEDFLTAWHLTQDEMGMALIQTHLNDPTWSLIVEFYIGLVDESEALVDTLLGNAVIHNDHSFLLQASRLAIVAPESCKWRGEVIKTLAKQFMLVGLDPDTRLLFGRYISLVAGESSRSFFIKMLRSSEVEVRSAALRGLGWSKSPRDMAILSAALNDETLEIQKSAILGLRDLGSTGATTLLKNYILDADEQLTPIIAQSLTMLPAGSQFLKEIVQHPDLLVRRAAVHGLGQIDEPWVIELLDEIIRTDPEWLVRSAAETAISSHQEEKERQKLILPQPKAEEIEWLMRWAARQGKGLGVGEAALRMLVQATQQGDANTKVLAVLTLNQIGRYEHLKTLQPLLHDPDELVKVQTTDVINNITHRYQIYSETG